MSVGLTTQINDFGAKWSRGLLVILLLGFAVVFGVGIGFTSNNSWYLLVGLVAIPLMFKFPVEFALGSFALALPFEAMFVAVKSSSGTTSLVWFVSALAVALLSARVISGVRQAPPRAAILWIVLIAWQTTTILWAMDTSVSVKRLPMAWSLLILYLVAVSNPINRKQLKVVMALFVVGGCGAAIWSSWGYLNGSSFLGSGRASLVLGETEMDPNYFAAMLLVPFSFALGIMISARSRVAKMVLGLAAALVGMTIFLSVSRGALLAMCAMLCVYGYRLRVKLRTVAVLVVLVGMTVALAAPDTFWKRISGNDVATGAGRTDIWVAGAQIVKHHFLLGVGLSNFPVAYNSYAGYAPTFKGFERDSHNTFLNITAEDGIVGLVLFLLAILYLFRGLERARKKASAPAILPICLQATLVGMLLSACFLDFLWTKVFWFTLILCTVVSKMDLGDELPKVEHAAASRSPSDAASVRAVFPQTSWRS
jgi:O-antigen ligase